MWKDIWRVLDVTEEPEFEISQARQYEGTLREMAAKDGEMLQRIAQIFEGMEEFFRFKKRTFLPIRKGIAEAKKELGMLRRCNASHESFLSWLEYFLDVNPEEVWVTIGVVRETS